MIAQIIIAVCGVASVWLSQSKTRHWQRWACIFGLVAQPAWFVSAYAAEQYGIMLLTFVYTAGWIRGVWNFWVIPAALEVEK